MISSKGFAFPYMLLDLLLRHSVFDCSSISMCSVWIVGHHLNEVPKEGHLLYVYSHKPLLLCNIQCLWHLSTFPCVRGTVHVQIHNWRSVYLLELMSKKRKEGQFFFSSPSPALQTHLHFHLFSGAPAFQFPGLSGVLRCQLDPVSLHFTLLIYSLSSDGPLPCHFLTVHPVRNLHPSSFQPQSLNLSKPKSVLNLSKL